MSNDLAPDDATIFPDLNNSNLSSYPVSNDTLNPTMCQNHYNSNLGGTTSQILLFFFKALIALIGMIGNYLVVIVYKRKRDCHPSEFLILSIAVVDCLFCTLNLVYLMFLTLSPILGYISNEPICNLFGCFINSASYTFTTFTSLFLICVITVNRYVAICMPHDYTKYFSRTMVRSLIMGAFLFGTVSCISPGLYCYAGPLAKMGGDIYWYSTKIILNVVNCVTMVIVYIKVLLQFRAKERKRLKLEADSLKAGTGPPPPSVSVERSINNNNNNNKKTSAPGAIEHHHASPTSQNEIQPDHEQSSGAALVKKSSSPAFLTAPTSNNLAPNGAACSSRRRCSDAGSIFNEEITYTRHGSIDNGKCRINCPEDGGKLKKVRAMLTRRTSKSFSKEKRVTMTLFAISVLYIIANLPSTLIDSILWYQQMVNAKNWLIPEFEKFSYLLYLIYFDLNPFIYFASNSFYRAQVITMFNNPLSFLWATEAYNRQVSRAGSAGVGGRH